MGTRIHGSRHCAIAKWQKGKMAKMAAKLGSRKKESCECKREK